MLHFYSSIFYLHAKNPHLDDAALDHLLSGTTEFSSPKLLFF